MIWRPTGHVDRSYSLFLHPVAAAAGPVGGACKPLGAWGMAAFRAFHRALSQLAGTTADKPTTDPGARIYPHKWAKSLFLIGNGGLLGAGLWQGSVSTYGPAIPALGALFVLAFWIMVKRAGDYYWHFRKRAESLEGSETPGQYLSARVSRSWLNTTVAINALFTGLFLLWIWLLKAQA